MLVSELVDYATDKYDVIEDKKIEELFGFSVLIDIKTKLWIAVMYVENDSYTGQDIQYCDIKCGGDKLFEDTLSYIHSPFYMKGKDWIGVKFDKYTDRDAIFALFDEAVIYNNQNGSQISKKNLSNIQNNENTIIYEKYCKNYKLQDEYQETVINFSKKIDKLQNKSINREKNTDTKVNTAKILQKTEGNTIILNSNILDRQANLKYNSTTINYKNYAIDSERFIPKKITDMRKLYKYGDYSFNQKVKNFYNQGKFMEEYEDDFLWNGEFHQYFPTYNDLNVRQLRGYFSWRSQVRKGNYQKISTSLAYLYLYELINGIGVSSFEESLEKMREFEIRFIESGVGDKRIQKDLRQWMLGLVVSKGIEPDIAKKYLRDEIIANDELTLALLNPQNHSDEEIFNALKAHYGNRLSTSAVIKKHGSYGIHLFAQVWRVTFEEYKKNSENLFEKCFGHRTTYRWYPFSNAIYYEMINVDTPTYELNECRKYFYKHGSWNENTYHKVSFNKPFFCGLIHEADRKLRLYLKTGHPLGSKIDEKWASFYVDKVIEIDTKQKLEEAKPKIEISFDNLEKIRQDALTTMDSLLTEEEKDIFEEIKENKENKENKEIEIIEYKKLDEENIVTKISLTLREKDIEILSLLLSDKSIDDIISTNMILPEVLADEINEIFFDEIGDNVVECELGKITLIEDYRQDVERLIKGVINE